MPYAFDVLQGCRPWRCGHPQILANQLTLSQAEGADHAHQMILAPSDFQTFLQPCLILYSNVNNQFMKDVKLKKCHHNKTFLVSSIFIFLLHKFYLRKSNVM